MAWRSDDFQAIIVYTACTTVKAGTIVFYENLLGFADMKC